MDWKTEAEALKLAVSAGVVPISEAIAWADAQISATVVPPIALIDVSLSAPAGIGGVVAALGRIPGEVNPTAISLRAFTFMGTALERDPGLLRNVVVALERMAIENIAPTDTARNDMFGFDDQLTLAEQQIFGTPESVLADVKTFLWAYGGPEVAGADDHPR